jgi:3-oxoadipate enol-lactonase
MPTMRLDGLDLYYEVAGAGPRLLFFNGSGATLASVAPLMSMLYGDFEIAAFDQRGIGRTPLPERPYAMADLAGDALALADHLGWQSFEAMGVSFGGMVAQEVAVTAPDRIDRLALLCTSSGGAGAASFPLQTLTDLDPAERAAVSAKILDSRFTPEWLETHEGARTLVSMMGEGADSEESAETRKGKEWQMQARRGHDVYERLPRITCPTIVASGRYDGIAPEANGAAIAAQIPNSTFRVFEGGHAFFVQDPAAFPEITAFLLKD